jgi:hypothetical protein
MTSLLNKPATAASPVFTCGALGPRLGNRTPVCTKPRHGSETPCSWAKAGVR